MHAAQRKQLRLSPSRYGPILAVTHALYDTCVSDRANDPSERLK